MYTVSHTHLCCEYNLYKKKSVQHYNTNRLLLHPWKYVMSCNLSVMNLTALHIRVTPPQLYQSINPHVTHHHLHPYISTISNIFTARYTKLTHKIPTREKGTFVCTNLYTGTVTIPALIFLTPAHEDIVPYEVCSPPQRDTPIQRD